MSYTVTTAGPLPDRTAIQEALLDPLADLFTKTIQLMLDSGELVIRDGVVTTPDERYLLVLPVEAQIDQL